ncbi:MAG: PDZ domain-containing protein [Planctomycetes bacterium]|nr:PDZ domain-containing protein [Planctomycetota bacterium]NBY02556.1 PDZ domain-containing protein [Planctomycetota bacterium]
MIFNRIAWTAFFLALAPFLSFETATQAMPLEIPTRVTKSSHLVVRVKINNKGPFNFIVDTGAPVTFFAAEPGKSLGLKPDENGWCILDKFLIEGGLLSENLRVKLETPFQLVGMNGMALGGLEMHGLIGYDLLAKHKIEIDVAKETMIWTPLDFKPRFPLGVSGKNSGSGLDTLGAFMKAVGTFTGKKQDSPPALRGALGMIINPDSKPLTIIDVQKDSPAYKVNIQRDDLILKFNGSEVTSLDELSKMYRTTPEGKKIHIEIMRKKQIIALELTPGKGL